MSDGRAPISGPPERFTISADRYRAVTVFALVMIAAIVVTGAAVRLSGSGMGCDTWPNCADGELIRFGSPNQTIEQVNRLFTGMVSISVIAAVLGSLRRRPYRRDLVWWSLALVGGVLGQIVLGGITVLVHLHPVAVSGHFVLSMILLVAAVNLVWKSRHGTAPARPLVGPFDVNLSRLAALCATALMVTGPLVTGSGPHAGDAEARRFGFFFPDVVRIHSINMWVFLVVTVVLLARLGRSGAPASVLRRGSLLLLAIVVQGGIGYTQYELGIPPWIVMAHIAGATTVVGLTVWFHLGLFDTDAPATTTASTSSSDEAAPPAGRVEPNVALPVETT